MVYTVTSAGVRVAGREVVAAVEQLKVGELRIETEFVA
jgi:hypothetical protein